MKKGLGKGLGALITTYEDAAVNSDLNEILEIEIKKVKPNKSQPRKHFKEAELAELAESIKEFGIIQPLLVQKEKDAYVIVAGERRWRAAQVAELKTVPVIVREYSELEILGISLIENIQRENLNPVEEALCYKRLNEDFGITQEEISKKIGKSRSHITNCIRVLKLDDRVIEMLASEKLSMGQAKAVLSVADKDGQFYVASEILAEGMNVRQSEDFVRKYIATAAQIEKELAAKQKQTKENHEIFKTYQKGLQSLLNTQINIKAAKTGGGGKIEISYTSQDELERIVERIGKTH